MKKAIMSKWFKSIFLLLGLAIASQFLLSARAVQARDILQTALDKIEKPAPGQIVHYSYEQYWRGPNPELEPEDPYHKPYAEIWPSSERIETWVEISSEGKSIRWRTQLRNNRGELLQDLFFDGSFETDYLPLDGWAEKSPQEAGEFKDFRVALIEEFLSSQNLRHQSNFALDGRAVISVYVTNIDLGSSSWGTDRVYEALLSFQNPFIADLDAISTSYRIDFDPTTHYPIGQGEVAWDRSGNEHIISYQTFGTYEIFSKSAVQLEEIFQQHVPEEAFQNTVSAPSKGKTISGLAAIAEQVDYDIYALRDGVSPFQLVSASLTIPDHSISIPNVLHKIYFAPSVGIGAMTIYINPETAWKVTIIQGPEEAMGEALRQTPPDWIGAERIQLSLGDRPVSARRLIDLDPDRSRYILEAGHTVLFVDGRGINRDQLFELLRAFAVVE